MFRTIRVLAYAALLAGLPAAAQAQEVRAQAWQCAPFARLASGIQIFGNAATWWDQAEGRYGRGSAPEPGAVLVFKAAGQMRFGHVATVSEVVDARTVKLTHANWSPINGARGQIEVDVEAVDVSPANDWSEVRVWYAPIGDIGTSSHPAYGFIYPDQSAVQLAAAVENDIKASAVQLAGSADGVRHDRRATADAIGMLIDAAGADVVE